MRDEKLKKISGRISFAINIRDGDNLLRLVISPNSEGISPIDRFIGASKGVRAVRNERA